MIAQIRELLLARGVTRAAIIDDAYDAVPLPGDIEESDWNRFLDDWSTEEEQQVIDAYGRAHYDGMPHSELIRDPIFVGVVWVQRETLRTSTALFANFKQAADTKLGQLQPLRELLTDKLSLNCSFVGRKPDPILNDAQLIFLDLYLGFQETKESIQQAISRIKEIVQARPERPPTVVLMSGSHTLTEWGDRVRDEAGLLGCQFRMFPKADLAKDIDNVCSHLYELVASLPDALKVNSLINAWCAALDQVKAQFVASVRKLDLVDYASVHDLILEAEGEKLGDYVLDLYEVHMHGLLEAQEGIIRAAKALNDIDLKRYPPAHLVASDQLVNLMDSAVFRSEKFTNILDELDNRHPNIQLGDVFLGPDATPRYAYVVLSQSCDLQHGSADRLLLLRGIVKPYDWSQHAQKVVDTRTPVMRVGNVCHTIEWDVLAPETWSIPDELKKRQNDGYRRVRQFRPHFALKLQQQFIGKLGRVGTMVTPPSRYPCTVEAFLRRKDGTAFQIAARHAKEAVLVGRDKDGNRYEKLLLSEGFVNTLRRGLREVGRDELPRKEAAALDAARNNFDFYWALRGGLKLNRVSPKGSKPFTEQNEFDLVQIFTRPLELENGSVVEGSWHPIVFEVKAE